MEWNDDLASLDEEPGLVDMETVNEEADTSVNAQEEANEVEKLERSRFPLKEGDIQYLVSKRYIANDLKSNIRPDAVKSLAWFAPSRWYSYSWRRNLVLSLQRHSNQYRCHWNALSTFRFSQPRSVGLLRPATLRVGLIFGV